MLFVQVITWAFAVPACAQDELECVQLKRLISAVNKNIDFQAFKKIFRYTYSVTKERITQNDAVENFEYYYMSDAINIKFDSINYKGNYRFIITVKSDPMGSGCMTMRDARDLLRNHGWKSIDGGAAPNYHGLSAKRGGVKISFGEKGGTYDNVDQPDEKFSNYAWSTQCIEDILVATDE